MGIAKSCAFAIIVLASFSKLAVGQMVTVDGNHLLTYCEANVSRDRVDDWDRRSGYCLGYLRAIANIMMSGIAVDREKACISPNADMNQIVDVFHLYMKNHPERRHLPAQNLVAEALASAFSCRLIIQ